MRLSRDDLIELADGNLAECLREHARWSQFSTIDERAGTLRTLGVTRFPAGMFNSVTCTGATPHDPAAWLAEQRAFYHPHQRGFSIFVRGARDRGIEDACRSAGLTLVETQPGMVCEQAVAAAVLDARTQVRQIEDVAELTGLVHVQALSYVSLELPETVTRKAMAEPERMLGAHVMWFMAYREGAPAAAAMVLLSHSIAGIYWVATLPAARGHGLADACTRVATNAAFARGARAVVLQASHMGEPIYRRLGYRELTRYPMFLCPKST